MCQMLHLSAVEDMQGGDISALLELTAVEETGLERINEYVAGRASAREENRRCRRYHMGDKGLRKVRTQHLKVEKE